MHKRFVKIVNVLRMVVTGRLGEEGLEGIEGEMKPEDLRRILDNCRNPEFLRRKWEACRQYSSSEAYRQFLRRTRLHAIGRRRIGIGVAAAVLLLVGWGGFRPERVRKASVVVVNDTVVPGRVKARLKLAGGKVLDVTGDSVHMERIEGGEIICSGGSVLYRRRNRIMESVYNELLVPVAEESSVTLDDGTRVWVNSASGLKYPVQFVGRERIVFLEGEAYFEVKKDGRPFRVMTPAGVVDVLGTSFGVKAYRDDRAVYTTLVSGRVSFRGSRTVELHPGEQAVAFADGRLERRKVDVAEFVGWRDGVYLFRRRTLESIMTDLSRWYGLRVSYRSPDVKGLTFTGNVKRCESIGTFLEMLQRTGEVRYGIDGNTVVLYK